MTDTGQFPGEGLPGNAGEEAVLHPQHADLPGNSGTSAQQPTGVPSWDTDPLTAPVPPGYVFVDQPTGPMGAEEDDLLLMPGPQASWGDPVPVPPQPFLTQQMPSVTPVPMGGSLPGAGSVPVELPVELPVEPTPVQATVPAEAFAVEPVLVEAVAAEPGPFEPVAVELVPAGPASFPAPDWPVEPASITAPAPAAPEAHEADGRESGSLDYGSVRGPEPVQPTPPPVQTPATTATPTPARRPLHMGPPLPDPATGGVVRSLADRGPAQAQAPVQTPPPVQASAPLPTPVRQPGPPTTGPEYLDVPRDDTTAIFGQAQAPTPVSTPAPVQDTVQPVTPAAGAAWPAPATDPAPAPVPVSVPVPVPVPVPDEVPSAETSTPDISIPAQAAPESEAELDPVIDDTAPLPFGLEPVVEEQVFAAEPEPQVAEPEPEPEPQPVVPDEPVAVTGAADAPVQPDPEPEFAPEPLPEAAAEAVAEPAADAPEELDAPEEEAVAVAAGPAAEGYDVAVRDAVHRVIRERRDIRNGFRSDPIPHEVLIRVLEAAHTAPSVGHSQPWDFVVIRSAKTRERMHELAMHQREAYAKSLPKGRAKQFRELKIEAILDTPVNIVVTADPTRGGRHTLGRYTQPQMAPYSSALAVENLWLAARAEGLGVGWVSFFDEREMVRELGLPEHLEVVAYLCVGYVDEFPEDPELVQAGWSKRRPLAWVVHEEEYGNRALPGEAPHDLLEETLRGIRPLDAKALGEAWERQKRMTKPAGALGMLEIISAQLSGLSRQCPPPIPEPAAVAIFAGDHGVHAQGVTAWPQEVTAQMVANFLGGGAVCNAFANQVGAEVCVIDVGVASELPSTPGLLPRKVRPGTADFTLGPAMSREEVLRAIEVGIETARDLVAAGNRALLTGEMGVANTTASAALISVYTGVDPAEVTGRGTGINDEMHARKIDVVRRALELHRPDPADPIEVLAAIGGLEHAAMVGLLLGAASLRTPVILDGVSAGAAALVARAIAPEVLAACIAGHRSAEPGHRAALTKLGLRPLVDLDLRLGEGTGALLALPLVQSAARAMHEVATFDSAGVTEKA
ncbi:nicotinate-nucleotide--dimethylbenzimidazole phosphoribosyltransferase [Actinacidiphila soli]|uniref:nicotinate-nucleotide--dimethylbenzimidazole phosphoribosyltransferase n=1 Tax=Actinacidiphila soli TaxID=2487275 RepID=UPI000FCC9417|nr:nicotinate-nucleotide--dimethylbenzimidazole phosphoribosyltransferase [Actinacidiphila soli]